MDLIHFIVTRKQREKRNDFEKDASKTPHVHFITIIAIRQKTFWCTIPSGRYILRIRLLRVNTSTRSKICQFYVVLRQQNIFRLNIPMENAISMHVINRFEQLVHIVFYTVFREIMSLPLDCIIHVDIHQLEYKRQTSRGFVI